MKSLVQIKKNQYYVRQASNEQESSLGRLYRTMVIDTLIIVYNSLNMEQK